MATERADQAAVDHVPKPRFAEQAGLARGGDQLRAIVTERHVVYLPWQIAECADHGPGLRRQQFDRAVRATAIQRPSGEQATA